MPVPSDTAAREALILGKPPRLDPLAPDELGEEASEVAEKLRVLAPAMMQGGIPPNIATMLRHPALYTRHLELGMQLLSRGTLAARDRELAILRTMWLCQAPIEWGAHSQVVKQLGLTSDDVERVTIGSTAPGWSDHEQAILRAAEELHTDALISDATWATLASSYSDEQLIELPILIGQYHSIAYVQNSLRLRVMPGYPSLSAR
jgi:alkylhydroperoxidase family enzyme